MKLRIARIFSIVLAACLLAACKTPKHRELVITLYEIGIEFSSGDYCCYKAQQVKLPCKHRCCVEATAAGGYCVACVPTGKAMVVRKPLKGGASVPVESARAYSYQRKSIVPEKPVR